MLLGLSEDFKVGLDPDLEPPDLWDRAWLPLVKFSHGGEFAAQCQATPTESSPVWRYETENMPGYRIAESVTDLVRAWLRLIDEGSLAME